MKTFVAFCALCIAAGGMALYVSSPQSQTYAAMTGMPTIEELNVGARNLPDQTVKEAF